MQGLIAFPEPPGQIARYMQADSWRRPPKVPCEVSVACYRLAMG